LNQKTLSLAEAAENAEGSQKLFDVNPQRFVKVFSVSSAGSSEQSERARGKGFESRKPCLSQRPQRTQREAKNFLMLTPKDL
jgi:hypothetical protein